MTTTHPLIDAQSLAQLLDSRTPPTVLDVRWVLGEATQRQAYDAEHIPGASWVEFEEALTGTPGEGGRHPMPDAEAFGAHMRAAGVSNDRAVVVYDAGNSLAAARARFLLRHFGHEDVQVLDGGLAAWKKAGFEVVSTADDDLADGEGDFFPTEPTQRVIDADEAARFAEEHQHALIDARAPERFAGRVEPVDPVAGHIPGATNVPALSMLRKSGRFLEPDDIQLKLTAAGLKAGHDVAVYCGSGVQAAHLALAIELSGMHLSPAVYVGSWSHWITDPERAVAVEE